MPSGQAEEADGEAGEPHEREGRGEGPARVGRRLRARRRHGDDGLEGRWEARGAVAENGLEGGVPGNREGEGRHDEGE